MTVTTQATPSRFELVSADLYRDIHKGIRSELFAMTTAAGRLDPTDSAGRADLARNVGDVVDFLVVHAEHEDTHVQPAIETYVPAQAATIVADHAALESRMAGLRADAEAAVDADAGELAGRVHALYLDLASFTSDYLRHQDVEERIVMPALDAALGFEAVMAINGAIVGSIPPPELAKSLAIMLPAMNVDGRAEMLGGIQAGAPAEVFAGIWSLACSVLEPADRAAVGSRLGIA